jgi:predicted anti-sigma-YlaC factor YlaD
MTKNLRCQDIESLLLEGEDRALAAGERRLVEEHLLGCEHCRGFAADRKLIREELAAVRWPTPPDELVLKTRRMLGEVSPAARAVPPAWVLVALAAVVIVTSVWLAFSLPEITPDTTLADLPFAARVAILVIVQNALMLFCAPVVLRTTRARRSELERARS